MGKVCVWLRDPLGLKGCKFLWEKEISLILVEIDHKKDSDLCFQYLYPLNKPKTL